MTITTILVTIILGVISSLIANAIWKSLENQKQAGLQDINNPNEINWVSLRRKIPFIGYAVFMVFGIAWAVLATGPELGNFEEYSFERSVCGWIAVIGGLVCAVAEGFS